MANYKGGARTAAKLKYPESYYVPGSSAFKKLSEKEMRAEYSRLRSIARKRLERLAVSEPDSKILARYQGAFPTTPDIKTRSDLARKLADVASFIENPRSSIRQSKQLDAQVQETLARHGINIPEKDLKKFGQFMEYSRARKKGRLYDSDRVAAVYSEAERLGVDPDALKKDFSFFYNNIDTISEIEALPDDKKATAYQLRKAIKQK